MQLRGVPVDHPREGMKGIVAGGGMRCRSFFVLVADVPLKVFARPIVSDKRSESFHGLFVGA